MIAFKNLLIFLIIFIYETTGSEKSWGVQYRVEIQGKLTCRLKRGMNPFVTISSYPVMSPDEDIIGYEMVNTDKPFTIVGKTEKNRKPNLFLKIRHTCFKKNDEPPTCHFKKIGIQIPSEFITLGQGEEVKVWDIGTLELLNTNSSFQSKCH